MTSIQAIAVLTLRSAVRSRLLLCLLLILGGLVICLPATIVGDGTLVGQVNMMIVYTLGLSQMLLAVVTLWAASASVSQEIEEHQIQLVVVKPVRAWQIWAGKWMGILLMDAGLLCLVFVALYAGIGFKASGETDPGARDRLVNEVLLCSRVLTPRPVIVDNEAEARLRMLRQRNLVDPSISEAELRRNIENTVKAERWVVPAGQTRKWTFDIPDAIAKKRDAASMTLRFKLVSSHRDRRPVSGTWSIGTQERPECFRAASGTADGVHRMKIPAGAIPAANTLVVSFKNADRAHSDTVMLDTGKGLEILVRTGSFGLNLANAGIILFCQLALLAALGVTASTMFSLPVATFFSTAVLIICLLSNSVDVSGGPVEPHHGPAVSRPLVTAVMKAGDRIIEFVTWLSSPVFTSMPIGRVADGTYVPAAEAAKTAWFLIFLYPAVIGLAGSLVLRRRELALPGSTT